MISFSHVLSEATVRLQHCETANCGCVFVGAMCARVCSSWKELALQAFPRFLADNNRKYCAFLIKEMLFLKFSFERLNLKYIKQKYEQRTGFVSDRACFHSQLVKHRPKKSQPFIFASFTIKTGFSD